MLGYALFAALTVFTALLFVPEDWLLLLQHKSVQAPSGRLLSTSELSVYNGEEGSRGLYLAILGQVFDVRKGVQHYGPGGAYHCMAGKDASLAFVTGDFTEKGQTDDLSSLSSLQIVALFDWLAFYQREYHSVGKVKGRFYDESGEPTETLLHVEALLEEGQRLKTQSEAERLRLPSCNSEWSSGKGGRFWCSTKSGGVIRDWIGVPRKYFSPASAAVKCVCVKDPTAAKEDPNMQEYDGCPAHAESCLVGE